MDRAAGTPPKNLKDLSERLTDTLGDLGAALHRSYADVLARSDSALADRHTGIDGM